MLALVVLAGVGQLWLEDRMVYVYRQGLRHQLGHDALIAASELACLSLEHLELGISTSHSGVVCAPVQLSTVRGTNIVDYVNHCQQFFILKFCLNTGNFEIRKI